MEILFGTNLFSIPISLDLSILDKTLINTISITSSEIGNNRLTSGKINNIPTIDKQAGTINPSKASTVTSADPTPIDKLKILLYKYTRKGIPTFSGVT